MSRFGSAADAATSTNCAAGANSSRSPLRKSFGICQIPQEGIAVSGTIGLRGQAQRDEGAHSWSSRQARAAYLLEAATSPQRHGRAKTVSGDNQRTLEFLFEPVESGKNIAGFSLAIVHSIAQAGAAKVEAQHGPAQAPSRIVEDLHGVVHNLVVEIAAEHGMGMADERGERSIGRSRIQNRLQTAGRTVERDAANCARAALSRPACVSTWSGVGVEFMPLFILRS